MNSGPDRNLELLRWFDELSELSAQERAQRLAAMELDDPGLAHGLRGMLGADSRPDGPLESGVESLVEVLVADGGTQLAAGQMIGPFRIERPLGRGGMGEVWLAAREESGFRQTVALKRLKRGMDSDEILRRFVQERRILAGLSHPNIARFIDGGVGADGVPWYAMEFVDGEPITVHATSRALDVRARVALLAQVAEAVAYAQHRLVVHRDLKPSNILVDADGEPHLLDFGIAKLLAAESEDGTATGVRALSPAYAAPEQILDEPISAATDVYALGVVLYELLTGALPHARTGLSLEALADGVRHETAERPSARLRAASTTIGDPARTQQTLRAVSGELDAIVLTALRREPDRRYASAAAMADDLRRWLDGRPVRAQPDTATYRMRKFVVRNKLAVGSASAVLLALIAGFGTALWQASVARQQAQLARQQAHRAEVVKDFFTELFDYSHPAKQARGAELTAREWIEAAADRIDAGLADAPEAQAEIRATLAAALLEFGASARAASLTDAAIPVLATAGSPGAGSYIAARQVQARLARDRGDLDVSEQRLVEALAALPLVRDESKRNELRLQLGTYRLTLANSRGRPLDALVLGEEMIAVRAQAYGPDDPRVAVDWYNLGATQLLLERSAQAEASLSRALALLRAAPDSAESRQALVLSALCRAQVGTGRLQVAADAARQARDIAERTLGPAHWTVQRAALCGAQVLRLTGSDAAALAAADALLAQGAGLDADVGLGAANLRQWLLMRGGRWDEASQVPTGTRGPLPGSTIANAFSLAQEALLQAMLLARQGQPDAARERVEQALALTTEHPFADGQRSGELRLLAAAVLQAAGERTRADELARAGLAQWQAAWAATGTAVQPRMPDPVAR